MDAKFVAGASLFASERLPFDKVLPAELAGAKVLEIGCGMGLHTEIMTRAGADVTAMDISPTSVEATCRRLALKGLEARVLRSDAEELPFSSRAFDFVWSWGVIHHSARTARIVREMGRVLNGSGSCRVMVYNRRGAAARAILLRDHWLRGGFRDRDTDETLFRASDGFSARYYLQEQFEDLFRAFFNHVTSVICGQSSDAVPLPSPLRDRVVRLLPEAYLTAAQRRRGSFIFLTASEPF